MHWAERYIGIPFEVGVSDCACLAVRVQREVFCREIGLPTLRASGARGWSRQIADYLQHDFARPTEAPEEGDAVLLHLRGRLSHIGTYCLIGGEAWVLHTMDALGSVLHRQRELERYQMRIAGFYKWM